MYRELSAKDWLITSSVFGHNISATQHTRRVSMRNNKTASLSDVTIQKGMQVPL